MTAFAPRFLAPSEKAAAKPGEESRISWPTTNSSPARSSSSANAAPKHSTTSSVS